VFYCKGHEDGDIFWPTFHGDIDNFYYVRTDLKLDEHGNII